MLNYLKKFFHTNVLGRKYYRTGQCLGCGKCCEKIYVKHFKGVVKEEKEFEKLRFLHEFYTYLTVIGKDEIGLIFSCSNLDEKTRLCKIHKKRPGICRRYPQEELFMMGGTISEDCGYKMIPIVPFSEVLEKTMEKQKNNFKDTENSQNEIF